MPDSNFFAQLGLLYRKRRIALKIKLETLATRSGMSTVTLRAMERGSNAVKIGSWLTVAKELGLADNWNALLVEPVDPFEEYDRQLGDEQKIRTARVRTPRRPA